jgi:hypothetical protein
LSFKLPLALILLQYAAFSQSSVHDLKFNTLAQKWDEAIPLGNGMIGALIWQKEDNLRFSLDRADLWDRQYGRQTTAACHHGKATTTMTLILNLVTGQLTAPITWKMLQFI